VSRQVNPRVLHELLRDEDPENAARVMAAMLKMGKIEIEELQRAYDGTGTLTPAP
jgi:predicted 3-demethylubiquinone-9 3-methyltransferase (glyoxalase superfamily)